MSTLEFTDAGQNVMVPIMAFVLVGFVALAIVCVAHRIWTHGFQRGRETGQRDMLEATVPQDIVR